jgi:NAD(P)-dependent dehydrogenase (short-subunit alcohol dehydrogenase family)
MFEFSPQDNALANKVILITGASDGIGRTAAKTYALLGAQLILLGRSQQKLESIHDEIESAGGLPPVIVPIDLEKSAPSQFDEIAKIINEDYGRLDGLLNNASILGTVCPFDQIDAQEWHQVMQVNLNSAFMLTQSMWPLLMASKSASIVFTSSGVGRTGRAYWGSYAVSKFATEGLMQTIADEIDNVQNIRCNCINPGGTRTKMRAKAFPGEIAESLPSAEDIMPAYIYLMDDASQSVNGQSLDAQTKQS